MPVFGVVYSIPARSEFDIILPLGFRNFFCDLRPLSRRQTNAILVRSTDCSLWTFYWLPSQCRPPPLGVYLQPRPALSQLLTHLRVDRPLSCNHEPRTATY